jgi:RNA polymerase sigma-32 factor
MTSLHQDNSIITLEHSLESPPNTDSTHENTAQAEPTKALVLRKETLPGVIPLPPEETKIHVQSLDAYIRFANQVPMLTLEEEQELARRLQQHNDLQAAERLILAHLRFVVKVARNFQGYGLPQADLIQEGNIGLMKAVKRFNPDIGVRLVSFAVHWIKAEMHEYIIKNWRMVKIATTKAQRKLFFNLRSSKKRLGWFTPEEVSSVAQDLNVKENEVLEMEKRMNAYDEAFEAPESDGGGNDDTFSPSMYLPSPNSNPEIIVDTLDREHKIYDALQAGLKALDPRSQDIIESRWLIDDKKTLHDLADKYQVSAERIRQIEVQALKQLKIKLS